MTAVEQLMIALYEGGYLRGNGNEMDDVLDKYKEVEKQQIIDAANLKKEDRWFDAKLYNNCGEKYYNETYGSGAVGDKGGAVTSSPIEEKLKSKADALLALREDLYEMHFHKSDRAWLIDAMIDFAGNNYKYFVTSSQTEISDEEIKNAALKEYNNNNYQYKYWEIDAWISACKWYREQLKSKQ